MFRKRFFVCLATEGITAIHKILQHHTLRKQQNTRAIMSLFACADLGFKTTQDVLFRLLSWWVGSLPHNVVKNKTKGWARLKLWWSYCGQSKEDEVILQDDSQSVWKTLITSCYVCSPSFQQPLPHSHFHLLIPHERSGPSTASAFIGGQIRVAVCSLPPPLLCNSLR